MNPREERGVLIAALCKLSQVDGKWVVPSQTGADKRYVVDAQAGTCTCPDVTFQPAELALGGGRGHGSLSAP